MLASLAYCSYSYCDITTVYGASQNAALTGYNWVMTNVLPQQAGLQVNSVMYRYTTEKKTEDDMVVHIQNNDLINGGYVFRSSDDWSGIPSNTIKKVVPANGIPIEYWGDGSIEVEGFGTVKNASVIYNYQYDPCFDPLTNPECPGYIEPFVYNIEEADIQDPLDDDIIQDELDRKAVVDNKDQEDRDRKKMATKAKVDARLEQIMGIVNVSLLAADAQAQLDQLLAMSVIPVSYNVQIEGGTYNENVVLNGGKLPDSKKGARQGLAQQLLHEQMVQQQYEGTEQ